MGSVNPSTPATLPSTATNTDTPTTPAPAPDATAVHGDPGWGFLEGISAMGRDVVNTGTDVATYTGALASNDDGTLKAHPDPLTAGTFILGTSGVTALTAIGGRTDAVSGVHTGFGQTFKENAVTGGIRVTPTLVSAIAGPAIADGVTMIAPKLVKKHVTTVGVTDAAKRKQIEKDNQYSSISRAVAGGLVVGLAAGAVFLLKPEIFKKFGEGAMRAVEGSTKFTAEGLQGTQVVNGVLDKAGIAAAMAEKGRPLAEGAAVNVIKTVAPMAKDATFTNRTMVTAAGGLATLLLANHAAGQTDPDKQKLDWGITAAAGLATIGGAYGIGKLTQRSMLANSGAGGLLAKNDFLMKPNVEWIKKYASTIAPITAVPAGTSASQYFNIVDDFDDITSTRSPFRK
jgi:hypothetical protein